MKEGLVSIIVPIFNAAKYLERTLKSIQDQTYTNLEILLIDDGSTDASASICQVYTKSDSRFKYYHQTNGGVSTARNHGLRKAIGEWIYFCDADDEIKVHGIQTLLNLSKGNKAINLVAAEGELHTQNGIDLPQQEIKKIFTPTEYAIYLFSEINKRYQGYLWTKLFKNTIIKEYNILFEEGIKYNEDRLFILLYLSKSKGKVMYSTETIYKYYTTPNSAMSRIESKRYKEFQTDLIAFQKCYEIQPILNSKELKKEITWRAYLSWRRNIQLINKYSQNKRKDKTYINSLLRPICSPILKRILFLNLVYRVCKYQMNR